MKELIDKLARGKIEYEKPVIESSVSEIDMVLRSEKLTEGSFELYTQNKRKFKGMVYSTHEFVHINDEDRTFISNSKAIRYCVDTKYLNEGDVIEGSINVVTDGGELSISFKFKVEAASVTSSIGEIKNLFHFANLVQINYDEALGLFKSPDFVHIFLEEDFYLQSMYESLRNLPVKETEIAMEEFFIAANKKSPTKISISETTKEYRNICDNQGDTILITKDNWGYTHIDVNVEGDFISVDKMCITSSDFVGSNYEFRYYVNVEKLHAGHNYGIIEFATKTQQLRFEISVKCDRESNENRKLYRKNLVEIIKKYIAFRVHKITMDEWANETLAIIDRIRNATDESLFIKLLQAQICISKGLETEAAWLLDNVAGYINLDGDKNDTELYCYYLYVRTIQKRDNDFTRKVTEKVKNIYYTRKDEIIENNSFGVLWILFYLDETYEDNVSIKLARIKEQFALGMKSPMMYYEALALFNEQPELLRVLDDFELQVLNFGSRQACIGKKLAEQVAELTLRVKDFNNILFSVLAELYDVYGKKTILSSIVSMLIKGNKTQNKYFLWYEEAVNEEIRLTSLYEYFIYSMPEDYGRPLPQYVLLYFNYNSDMSDEKLALVYENVIKYKNELEAIYKSYENQIEKFAFRCMAKGIIDEHIAVIYKEVMKEAMITAGETLKNLPAILNTYLIRCNQQNIREVMVMHKEMNEVCKYPVVSGKAYVQIYSEDAAIIFCDTDGMYYGKSVDYTMVKLLEQPDYLDLCYEMNHENKWLILYKADRYLKYRKQPEKSIEVMKKLAEMDCIREEYKTYVSKDIVDYYSSNYDLEAVDEYLKSADVSRFGTKSRIKFIELLIMRGMYEKAYEAMLDYGYSLIDTGRLLRCVSKLIDLKEFAKEEALKYMALHAYRKGKYNENTLTYLSMYHQGSTGDMYEIWKTCKAYDYENRELEESLIACILYTGVKAAYIVDVYKSYAAKGMSDKLRRAFLFAKAHDYFIKEKLIDEMVFEYIKWDIIQENTLHDICKMAYMKYCSQKPELDEKEQSICQELVFYMCKKGKVFEFYKSFGKYFNLPVTIMDKKIIEYHTNPECRVFIHYAVDMENVDECNYMIKEMKDICGGIFTQEFIMFYGENIQYYITEEFEDEKIITESCNESLSDTNVSEVSDKVSRYTMINDMLVSFDMHEESTLSEMAGEYILLSKLTDNVFKIS